jgi:vitamin B12 transporter
VAGKPSLPDYTLLGAGLSYAVSENATAYLRVDNISDEDYQTSLGYNMPGRTWTVGLSAEF